MTRPALIAFLAFAVAGCAAVTAFAVVDRTVPGIVLAVVVIVFTASLVTKVVRGRR